MDIIRDNLELVKKQMFADLQDPFSDKSLTDFLSGKSKMIRSGLAILYLKSINTGLSGDIYKLLAAGELIHNASLLHDDVIDDAETRRGEQAFYKKFNSKISILTGDFLVSRAVDKLININNIEIIRDFELCIKNMAEAEIKQYSLRGSIPSREDYLEICEGKTARLFSTIMKCSAMIAGVETSEAEKFGKIFGIVFQIKDDLSENSANIDAKNGIKTAKDIFGIENTLTLLDNYKSNLKEILNAISDNEYKRALGELIDG